MAFKYDRGFMFLAFNDCFCGEREGICVDDLQPPAGGSLMLMRLTIIHQTIYDHAIRCRAGHNPSMVSKLWRGPETSPCIQTCSPVHI